MDGKNPKSSGSSEFILETSLQGYFFELLHKINSKSTRPLPKEMILYSSLVMGDMGESKRYFDMADGKAREKILGIKLMEAGKFPVKKQKRVLRDIGDTALLLCGYFFESINNKIVNISYYQELGKTAYRRLNALIPDLYNTPSFFKIFSEGFDEVTNIIGIVSKNLDKNHLSKEFSFLISDATLKAS